MAEELPAGCARPTGGPVGEEPSEENAEETGMETGSKKEHKKRFKWEEKHRTLRPRGISRANL